MRFRWPPPPPKFQPETAARIGVALMTGHIAQIFSTPPPPRVRAHLLGCKGEVVVGHHDPLGRARGAAGVHQVAAEVGRQVRQPPLQLRL